MIGFICGLIATLIFTVAATGAWAAQPKRVALVIGNGAYQFTSPLTNPTNDAGDMAAALKRLGFEVLEGRDLDESGMRRTIKGFAELLIGADVGLLFYAGHGLQVNGQNYLVPVDAKLQNAAGLDFELIRLDVIHRTMERETKTNVIFLDACRDNPLSRNLARSMGTRSSQIGKGLAVVESGVGTLISFSTQPGNTALDGEGRNSPFAASLIRHISDPREDLSTLLIQVRNDVMAATKDQQIPWEHSALRSKFYFAAVPPQEPAARTEELRKALDEVRMAREAAKDAEEKRLAAVKAAEDATKQAQEAIALKRASERQGEPAKVAALAPIEKPQGVRQFDGVWSVISRSEGCKMPGWVTDFQIAEGTIKGAFASGRISTDGKASWRLPDRRHGGHTNYSGTFEGNGGTGTFSKPGTPCSGTFTARRY